MKTPDTPIDETHRLQALHGLDLLDSAPEPAFDDIVAIGRRLFAVPTCLVTLVDSDRQWFKARCGLNATETSRAVSFCGHAILGPEVFVIPDARADERFADNPLVTGEPHIRFYAGAPIRLPNGYTIGTVCLLSPMPRTAFPEEDCRQLAALARMALEAISVRALRRELDDERDRRQALHRALDCVAQPVALLAADGTIRAANPAFAAICDDYPAAGVPIADLLAIDPAALDLDGFGDDLERTLTLPTAAGERRLSLRLDVDGYIVASDGA